jgi:uncharacterized protein involved in tellurium resistance
MSALNIINHGRIGDDRDTGSFTCINSQGSSVLDYSLFSEGVKMYNKVLVLKKLIHFPLAVSFRFFTQKEVKRAMCAIALLQNFI